MKKFLAVIPARGGSKSIPKKNIVDLNGKPLIAWSIEASLNSKYINKTVVSSDDDEILNVSEKFGADIIRRPEELSKDNSRTEPVLLHVLENIKCSYDYLVLLQATSPLRTSKHIDEAIEKILADKSIALFSVYEPSHSALKAFIINEQGYLEGIRNNEYPFMPRQELPKTYYPNGAIYIVDIPYFAKSKKLFHEKLTSFYEMDQKYSVDIDTYDDLNKLILRIV